MGYIYVDTNCARAQARVATKKNTKCQPDLEATPSSLAPLAIAGSALSSVVKGARRPLFQATDTILGISAAFPPPREDGL